MKIAVSGASGFVGKEVSKALEAAGHKVVPIIRVNRATSASSANRNEIAWDPTTGLLNPAQAENLDGVIHLAGKSIGDGRWSESAKSEIRNSRVQATRILAENLVRLNAPPKVVVSASAIGVYGNRGEALVTEESPTGDDFLSQVADDWEQACDIIRDANIRVAHPRLGIVLHPGGGALAKMLPLFRFWLGGRLGSGKQFWSWISRIDCVRAIVWMLENESAEGPFNLVAPEPLTNAEFTTQLGAAMGKPTILPAPAFALRLALGEMADALLLNSCRVSSQKIETAGFQFEHRTFGSFLNRHFANRRN